MKYLNGEYYVEVKDHRYKIHPTENIILRKRDIPASLRTQYQVKIQTQIRTNQRVIRKDDNELIGRIKIKFYKNLSDYYKEMKKKKFQTNNIDPFSENAQGISKIYHEVLLLMKFLQTKPQVKNMDINYYDLYYTVIKTRNENKNIDNQYEDDYHDYIDINDFFMPLNYAPSHETILR